MSQAELITAITAASAFLSPRIIALVPGGKARKQRMGNLISVIVGLLVSLVETGIFTGDAAFSFASLSAFLIGAVGTKGGQQAIYDGYWKDKLGPKDEPFVDVVAALEAERGPITGQVQAVPMDVPHGSTQGTTFQEAVVPVDEITWADDGVAQGHETMDDPDIELGLQFEHDTAWSEA